MFTWRKEFWFITSEISKITEKNLIFLLLLICQNIELCPGPHAQEDLSDISKLRGIKLAHQNIMGLLNKKTYIINFVYK